MAKKVLVVDDSPTDLQMLSSLLRKQGYEVTTAVDGEDALDKAALDIMQKVQPLPPIPDRMHTDRVDGQLPINFGVRSFNESGTTGNCRG